MIKIYRIVSKERDRRGYELAAIFDSQREMQIFLQQRAHDRADHHIYSVGLPTKKKKWWKFW